MSLDPALSIIAQLGGATNVSKALGVSYSQVRKWTWSKERGGTGGLIPQRHHIPVLDLARALNKPLVASDFLPSRNSEIAA
jgi:hypothetical protein